MQHHLGAHLLWQDPYCGLWIFSTTRGCLYTTQLSTASLSHLSHPLSKSALLLGLSASLLSLSSVQVTPVDVGGKRKKIFSFWVISVEQFCLQDSNTEYSTVSSRRLRKKSNVNSHFFFKISKLTVSKYPVKTMQGKSDTSYLCQRLWSLSLCHVQAEFLDQKEYLGHQGVFLFDMYVELILNVQFCSQWYKILQTNFWSQILTDSKS